MFCIRAVLYTNVAKTQSTNPNKNGILKKDIKQNAPVVEAVY